MKTVSDKVVVKPFQIETKTASGIILDSASIDTPSKGTVVTCGPECKIVKTGDIIYYGKYPTKLDYNGESYIIINEKDILIVD